MINFSNVKGNKRAIAVMIAAILSLVLIGLIAGSLWARYVTEREKHAEMVSAGFHISSDYLEEAAQVYSVTDWGYSDEYQISFKIYNYEKTNSALISEHNVEYKIDVAGWQITVKDENGDDVIPANSVYTLVSNGVDRSEHTVYLKRISDAEDQASVVVTTTAPFTKKLSAVFNLVGEHDPVYTVVDNTTFVKVIINTNNFNGDLTVSWSDDFSPDNTDPLMRDWSNDVGEGNLSVTEYKVYELIFFKNKETVNLSGIVINGG